MAEYENEKIKALQFFIYTRETCDTLECYKESAALWFNCQYEDEKRIQSWNFWGFAIVMHRNIKTYLQVTKAHIVLAM